VVNLNISPEWLELRALVVGPLEPHPAACGYDPAAITERVSTSEEQVRRLLRNDYETGAEKYPLPHKPHSSNLGQAPLGMVVSWQMQQAT
jgi:hypothetical protein